MMEAVFFYFFSGIALLSAINVIAQRKVIYSAISLIICLCSVAALYLALDAPFIAAIQIIVYAGAIMVLFLFVIMMVDPFSVAALKDKKKYLKYLAVLFGIIVISLLVPMLRSYNRAVTSANIEMAGQNNGSVAHLGQILFNEFLLPFEITSVLILVAIMGVVVLAKKHTQKK
jgi:NADH-quinone oxidoreductase subunit J